MSNERAEQIKKILLEGQQSSPPLEQLIDQIVAGSVKLLSAQEICDRLGLSENELTRLVRKNDPTYPQYDNKSSAAKAMQGIERLARTMRGVAMEDGLFSFPPPDIYIVGKARWSADTLKKWLFQGAK